MLKKGFYTAVGTPLDNSGSIIASSLHKHIVDQIEAGASGILLFGSMGMGGCINLKEYVKGIEVAVAAINKRCTLLVGASENSLNRVYEKISILNECEIDGIVVTPPYYLKTNEESLTNFFIKTASMTSKDYYIYDHEPITKHKITYGIVEKLEKIENIKGIKSNDIILIKQIFNNFKSSDFTPVFSGSDIFDMAYMYGIEWYLDGIFACMPKSISALNQSFEKGKQEDAKKILDGMMNSRNVMISTGLWPAFSYAMNLLGYDGNFFPDYETVIDCNAKKIVEFEMKKLGEI